MARLLINIDHVATLRNARGEGRPSVLDAAKVCMENGSQSIVFHLREDRRHIKDYDVLILKEHFDGFLDFEMATTNEMLDICADIKPQLSTLVPEKRQELTTEGGLDVVSAFEDLKFRVVPKLNGAGVPISLFLDPNEEDILKAAELGVHAVELHTGTFALATGKAQEVELERLVKAAELIHKQGMIVNAGHGLDFDNIELFLKTVPHLHDVSIGHAIISKALFVGLGKAVSDMAKFF